MHYTYQDVRMQLHVCPSSTLRCSQIVWMFWCSTVNSLYATVRAPDLYQALKFTICILIAYTQHSPSLFPSYSIVRMHHTFFECFPHAAVVFHTIPNQSGVPVLHACGIACAKSGSMRVLGPVITQYATWGCIVLHHGCVFKRILSRSCMFFRSEQSLNRASVMVVSITHGCVWKDLVVYCFYFSMFTATAWWWFLLQEATPCFAAMSVHVCVFQTCLLSTTCLCDGMSTATSVMLLQCAG